VSVSGTTTYVNREQYGSWGFDENNEWVFTPEGSTIRKEVRPYNEAYTVFSVDNKETYSDIVCATPIYIATKAEAIAAIKAWARDKKINLADSDIIVLCDDEGNFNDELALQFNNNDPSITRPLVGIYIKDPEHDSWGDGMIWRNITDAKAVTFWSENYVTNYLAPTRQPDYNQYFKIRLAYSGDTLKLSFFYDPADLGGSQGSYSTKSSEVENLTDVYDWNYEYTRVK